MLVHKHFGKRPPYGILHYSGRDFAIDYTAQLEAALLEELAEIRRDEGRRDVPRSHEELRALSQVRLPQCVRSKPGLKSPYNDLK